MSAPPSNYVPSLLPTPAPAPAQESEQENTSTCPPPDVLSNATKPLPSGFVEYARRRVEERDREALARGEHLGGGCSFFGGGRCVCHGMSCVNLWNDWIALDCPPASKQAESQLPNQINNNGNNNNSNVSSIKSNNSWNTMARKQEKKMMKTRRRARRASRRRASYRRRA